MHSFTVYIEGHADSVVEAQIVQANLGMPLTEVLSAIYDSDLDGRLRAEMLIIRLPVGDSWSEDEIVNRTTARSQSFFRGSIDGQRDAFERARDRSVHILSAQGGSHFLTRNLSPHWSDDPLTTYDIKPNHAILSIRRAEIESILTTSKAVLTCPTGSLYRAPSGRLVRSFARVGNIQYSRDAVDAIFFWLLPRLKDVGAILTDTWSISSIAFNIAKLCQDYFGGGPRCVEMLPHYPTDAVIDEVEMSAVVGRVNSDWSAIGSQGNKLLCLISATHSGRLAKSLQSTIDKGSFPLEPIYITIFALGKTEIEYLHDLSDDNRFKLIDEPSEVNTQPIKIDKQVYFPLTFEDIKYEINQSVASSHKAFFDRYANTGLLKVHVNHKEIGRPRHHCIHMSTEVLLDNDVFLNAYDKKLEKLPSAPAIIVSPPHAAGRGLANRAAAFFKDRGATPDVYAHPNLYFGESPLAEDDQHLREAIKEASEESSLLVIDDVSITGTRLAQYQRYIRSERFKGRVYYLVGIARPRSLAVWENLRRYIRQRPQGLPKHTVEAVEFVVLPDWRGSDCPWCCEQRLYEKWAQDSELPTVLVDRLRMLLGSAERGLTEDLFLAISSLPKMKLGPTSLFVEGQPTQADTYAAVSAALQTLRGAPGTPNQPPLGPRRYPISTVLFHEDYLRAKWSDSILRATFFRAAIVDELIYANEIDEKDRTRVLRELITQDTAGEHDVALEVALAAAQLKCTIGSDSEIWERLKGFGDPEAFEFLRTKINQESVEGFETLTLL